MKIIKSVLQKDGTFLQTISLGKNEKLISIRDDAFYILGGQLEDVVHSAVLEEARLAYWCIFEQKWKDE